VVVKLGNERREVVAACVHGGDPLMKGTAS